MKKRPMGIASPGRLPGRTLLIAGLMANAVGAAALSPGLRNQKEQAAANNAKFRKQRDEVLRSLDPAKMEMLMVRWGQKLPETWYTDPTLDGRIGIMHYARLYLGIEGVFTTSECVDSAKWLLEKKLSLPSGFTLADDESEVIFHQPNDPAADKPNMGMDTPVEEEKRDEDK